MTTWDSAYCLAEFKQAIGRPSSGAGSDDAYYRRLSKSQNRVITELASVAPMSLYPKVAYGLLPQLQTSDNQIFRFPLTADDDTTLTFPFGKGGIYASLDDIPDCPWVENVDFMNEGNQIRIPNNGTYSGPLFWYGVAFPSNITADNDPVLIPEQARELIVIDAARQYGKEGARNPQLVGLMQDEWDRAWPECCLLWRTQFENGGALRLTGLGFALGGVTGSALSTYPY